MALAKLDPGLVAWLLRDLFGIPVPDYHHARGHTTDVRVMVPRTYHADSMVLFCDPDDQPLLAVVLEVQRSRDPGKRRSWKLYLAQLEAELGVDSVLMVYCPDLAVAACFRPLRRRCGRSIRSGRSCTMTSCWPRCRRRRGFVGRTS